MDDKQRALALFTEIASDLHDQDAESELAVQEIKLRMSNAFPGITDSELIDIMREHAERHRAASQRLQRQMEREDYLESIVRRDPGWQVDDTVETCLRRLAEVGDREAAAILASWESPLNSAIDHVVESAVAVASDWTQYEDESIGPTGKDSRKYSELLEDHMGQAGFDVLALLPEELRAKVNSAQLLLALNKIIQEAKDEGD
jgi:hypothetical protein